MNDDNATQQAPITERQIGIIKHALGLDLEDKKSRNYFVADEGSLDYLDCENLVEMGMMTRWTRPWIYTYSVTPKGRKAFLSHIGER